MKTTILENKEVKVGDWVCFSYDTEQHGKIVEIKGRNLLLENKSGFAGDYIGGETQFLVEVDQCWKN